MSNQPDTYSYKGWLNSDSFFKRAFAVFGYGLVAQLFIYLAAGVLLIVFMILAGVITMLVN